MRKLIRAVSGILLASALAHTSHAAELKSTSSVKAIQPAAETTADFSVQASAVVQASPARITLHWPQDSCASPRSYTIYRKAPTATTWGKLAVLPGSALDYADSRVSVGVGYEYQIIKSTAQNTGYGYVYAGIKVPLEENRGKLLLVTEESAVAQLAPELARLRQDLVGDGWTIAQIDVGRKDTVASVKERIKSQYDADPANVKAVFLFGHVPVPYSGDIAPDGHVPDHQGAWPCDGFYGDMDGVWTDSVVKDNRAADARNRNVPGDGKYDQSAFPAPLKLMVGRVDLANMPGRLTSGGAPTFPGEIELLRNYLKKDHAFRQKEFDLPRRGIVGDYFGVRDGEAFAASGWRNMASFFDAENVTTIRNEGGWIPALSTNSYLWAYGCGPGSFTSIGGIGNSDCYHDGVTTELIKSDVKAAFTLLYGSWLGDWDSEDNLQRAILALPSYGLTCGCSGRPHWFLHHMALGEPIGFSTRLTQNNRPDGLYQNQQNNCAAQTHIALMGDPTLRMHIVAPPTGVATVDDGKTVNLNWAASHDHVAGYNVYRASNDYGPFARLNKDLVTETSYTDKGACSAPNSVYMVRAVKLETSASGSYFNASQGAFVAPNDNVPASIAANPANFGVQPEGKGKASTPNPTPTGSATNYVRALTPTGATAVTNNTPWMDDSLPSGAIAGADGGDWWSWVNNNPTPYSGSSACQSSIGGGLHQHYFTFATSPLTVNAGETLMAYVYLDPANLPSEVMLQWYNGTWEHRAYWGANNISYGAAGSAGRQYMGPLPTAGQWVRLEVPASQLGLEGSSLSGMAFSQYDGRATWDYAGKSAVVITNIPTGTNTNTVTLTNGIVWVDDSLPAGAVGNADGGDSWNWTSSNPAPFSGGAASQSAANPGSHQHYFTSATRTLSVSTGDVMFAYVYMDPANLPSELMLQWNDGSWEHRAYWGTNAINYGVDATPGHRYMGTLPAAGQWVRLQVPASQVGLEGSTVSGMAFSLYNGGASWDYAGKASVTSTNSSGTNSVPTNGTNDTSITWVEDALPTGAIAGSDGGDAWSWVSSNPSPYSGSAANQSAVSSGMHQHYFGSATTMLPVATGDNLFAYVYIDPANPPSELMLQWNDGSWEHRAYWGGNTIGYGTDATPGRRFMGALPASGQWVRLEVPASQVGLEGSTLNGMAFSLYGGRATWDKAGKSSVSGTNTVPTTGGGTNGVITNPTNTVPTGTNGLPTSGTNGAISLGTNSIPGLSIVDYATLALPPVGTNALHILAPNVLELKLINTKAMDPARVAQWDLVDSSGNFTAPPTSAFTVLVNGQPVSVASVGFKRRPLYAPFLSYDLRIENSLYLQLSSPVSDNQTIEVRNPGGSLWPSIMQFIATSDPLRYSPAIHVNQEGYMPNYPKKAMVGYFIGNLGELTVPSSAGYKLVDATTGVQVYQGNLSVRGDVGWNYSPAPYQKVYEADFSAFNTPGEYRLVVPGLGGSLPFMIDNGIAMDFTRAYALGLYHQRCGTNTAMPYTRFTHDICHSAPASVPWPASSYPFTWTTLANYGLIVNPDNPVQTAPPINAGTQLFPFQRQGAIDTDGGHHDAGDYSKYTINSASLIHYLMFAVDSLPGVAALDNMGIPESGDGIPDLLQEAKWEADYVAKLQDTDGGFYFLTYPVNREYEAGVTPDHGDPQVVWPKTTSVTAASVAALAQCASSPAFKRAYPATAAQYLQKAQLGWQFLMNAINTYGKNGAYQKITHYGDNFADQDELAWAACEMYLATGDQSIHQKLLSWFDPSNSATWRWGWWHMSECYGHAVRSYAFAVRSGRFSSTSQLDSTFLGKCQNEIIAAGDMMLRFYNESAYGTSFPDLTKGVRAAGWYFSSDQAFDMTVAYQLNAKPEYITALLGNMNYEGGCNPVNVTYITGLGWKRQREIVSQWASTDTRVLPPSGIPVGNVQAAFAYLSTYGTEVEGLVFPGDDATSSPYPYYDRWTDGWNVTTEFVVLNSAKSLGSLAFLAAQTGLKTQAWRSGTGKVIVPTTTTPVGSPVTLSLQTPGLDVSAARITWEARDQEPAFGSTFTLTPKNNGSQWVEVEAQWPDGRRVFATTNFNVNSPNIVWVDDALPNGATSGSDGGDSWNWVTGNPTAQSGSRAIQSSIAPGEHQIFFSGAGATMSIGTGDTLYAWVYLDPANMPSEIMLQWNDGSSWEHRAYWGGNSLGFGIDGTTGRHYMGALPASGRWVQLQVPASAVALEGKTVSGMAFTLYGGRATWDTAGRLSTLVAGGGNTPPVASLQMSGSTPTISWNSTSGTVYQVRYKNGLADPTWLTGASVTATANASSWIDTTASSARQRFYMIAQL